jgi:hypothetical protein
MKSGSRALGDWSTGLETVNFPASFSCRDRDLSERRRIFYDSNPNQKEKPL